MAVAAVIATVTAVLLTLPSFTTREATKMPATSAVNVGFAEVGLDSVAKLPAGLDVSDQA